MEVKSGGQLLRFSADADSKGKLFVESILPNRVLDELKKQASEGCLLCSFDAWDEEEWD